MYLVAGIAYHKFATAHKALLNRTISPENLLVLKTTHALKIKCIFLQLTMEHY